MGVYQYIRNVWKKPKQNTGALWKERLIAWRKGPTTVRIKRPTRLDRARSLGYKAKQGVIVVRQRVARGGHVRERNIKGHRTKTQGKRKNLSKNYKQIAEERANKKFVNCEVLNSYYVAHDGKFSWYEVILIDRAHPAMKKDKQLKGITTQRGRVFRGRTSAGRKSRGLHKKGMGAEKVRGKRHVNKKRAFGGPQRAK